MKYSLIDFITEYKKNKINIDSYLQGNTIEHYKDSTDTMFGLSTGLFVSLFMINIIIWIWALWSLVTYWKYLPDWAKVLGVIGVLPIVPGGVIMTLIVVYIGRQ